MGGSAAQWSRLRGLPAGPHARVPSMPTGPPFLVPPPPRLSSAPLPGEGRLEGGCGESQRGRSGGRPPHSGSTQLPLLRWMGGCRGQEERPLKPRQPTRGLFRARLLPALKCAAAGAGVLCHGQRRGSARQSSASSRPLVESPNFTQAPRTPTPSPDSTAEVRGGDLDPSSSPPLPGVGSPGQGCVACSVWTACHLRLWVRADLTP